MKRGWLLGMFIVILSASALGQQYCTNPCVPDVSRYCALTAAGDCCPQGTYEPSGHLGLACPASQEACIQEAWGDFQDDCTRGCCLSLNTLAISCQEDSVHKVVCEDAYSGTFSATCATLPDCAAGCCCYTNNAINASKPTFLGECQALLGQFTPGQTTQESCAAACGAIYVPPGTGGESECSDGIDNDGDSYLDFGSDDGCVSADDNSEANALFECNDGQDNDADGETDDDDTCCLERSGTSESICDLQECGSNGQVGQGIQCRCNGAVCTSGNYCCATGCTNIPCGSTQCAPGERKNCGLKDPATGCELYLYCRDGQWDGECATDGRKDPLCGVIPEVCDDNIDNDGNGAVDCNDVFCAGLLCGADASGCEGKGYLDFTNSLYRCCFAGTVNDCDGDVSHVPDTCGSCDCQATHPVPSITEIRNVRGEQALQVLYTLNCDADVEMLRCTKTGTGCTNPYEFSSLGAITTREYRDTTVQPESEYCYMIQAEYGDGTRVESAIKCRSTGAALCSWMPPGEFCLDEAMDTLDKKVLRYTCNAFNELVEIGDCRGLGESFVCMGPDQTGDTECVFQSECELCGTPLSMYSSPLTSRTMFAPLTGGQARDTLCKDIPTCYFDFSSTIKDDFQKCAEVQTCYDYASQAACEGDTLYGTEGANNRCLGRDCVWNTQRAEFSSGICQETVEAYKQCSFCNIAEHNNVIDDCTVDRCRIFGDNSGGCYLDRNGMCTDIDSITCNDFITSQECTGGQNAVVDVSYAGGERVSGTNVVTARSRDAGAFGVCKWNPQSSPECFKDANGDDRPDADPTDMIPPETRILTPAKVGYFNFSAVALDRTSDSSGTECSKAFYYSTDGSYPSEVLVPSQDNYCYVEVLRGAGHGTHTIRYYSEDLAENIEPVKSFEITVDRMPPVIQITPYVANDLDSPFTDSSVTLLVQLDEDAICNDYFEGIQEADRKIKNGLGNTWVVKYSGLSDGFYDYVVNCTDRYGNFAEEAITVRINADSLIYSPLPSGKIDYGQVTLSILTESPANCKWDVIDRDYSQMANIFSYMVTNGENYYYASYNAVDSRSHQIFVKCSVSGRISSDEIQFIHDELSPVTAVVDALGAPFNFTRWYNGIQDMIYLKCDDRPQGGFGCNETFYCVSSSACTPSTRGSNLEPITYDLSPTQTTWLCYYSSENTEAGMGGLIEQVKCDQIKVDSVPPYLRNVNLEGYDSANPYVTIDSTFEVTGQAIDPDAQGSIGNNIITIRVNAAGSTREYTSIPGNPDFRRAINLSMGLNTITISVTDRSGQASAPVTYYARLVEYVGQKIEMIQPTFGVSQTRLMDLRVRTYKQMECRFSIDDFSFDASARMSYTQEGRNHYSYFNGFNHPSSAPGIIQPIYFKCRDNDGLIHKQVFEVVWDNTEPEILEVKAARASRLDIISDYPLSTSLLVKTDDPVRCKYSVGIDTDANSYSSGMIPFQHFPEPTGFNGTNPLLTENNLSIPALTDKTTYDYYVQCENGAGLISDKAHYRFQVDTSLASSIVYLAPDELSSNSTFKFLVQTTKQSTSCKYGKNETMITSPMRSLSSNLFESDALTLQEGEYTYWFSCITAIDVLVGSYTFEIDLTPPEMVEIEDGNCSASLTSLSAKWKANDSISKVSEYNYSIGTSPGSTDIRNWTNGRKSSVSSAGLNLTEGETYYWNVRAMNELGLWGETLTSDGVLADSICYDFSQINQTPVDTCKNGLLDSGETDIDCGGLKCSQCLDNSSCQVAGDCASLNCQVGKCTASSCQDMIKNQGESAVDCGGMNCEPCEAGADCFNDLDCSTAYCAADGTCKEPSCDDGIQNGDETGRDCGGNCQQPCLERPGGCTVKDEEGNRIEDLDCDGMADEWEVHNGLDPRDLEDADLDPDKDGFTNVEEYANGTDPNKFDGKKSGWLTWLLIAIIIGILGAGGYYGYTEYKKKGSPKQAVRMQMPGPMGQQRRQPATQQPAAYKPTLQQRFSDTLSKIAKEKRKELRTKQREDLMSKFESGSEAKGEKQVKSDEPPVPEQKQAESKRAEEKQPDKKEKDDDTFKQLEKFSSKKTKQEKTKKALDSLSQMVKKKKGQVPSEMLFYIMAIIVIGLLMFFGIRWIGALLADMDQATALKFKNDLENSVSLQRTKPFGSWQVQELDVPGDLTRICFVDKNTTKMISLSGLCVTTHDDYDPLLCELAKHKDEVNVFVVPSEVINTPLSVGHIKVDTENGIYACFVPEGGLVRMKMTSKGSAVMISSP